MSEARIVVGVDGSEGSQHALRWAARQAELTGARLEVVTSWEYPATYGWVPVPPEDYALEEFATKSQEEAISADLYAEAAMRLRQHITARNRDPADYARHVREVLLYADPMHWASRSERYKVIADRLEEIAQEIPTLGSGVARG